MAELQDYKCPCCGGALEWNSEAQKVKCPYCDTEFDVQTIQTLCDDVNASHTETADFGEEGGGEWQNGEESSLLSYVCKSCGGEIVCDENTAATSCPWCGNPIVVTGKVTGSLRPDYVIPFKLSKEDAKKGLESHIKGKKLLPAIFKDRNHIDEIKGIYVPFWLYDAQTDGDMRFRGTRVRTWSDPRYHYTETSYYAVMRSGSLDFEHVPVDGSSKMQDEMMESIEPFNFSEAVDFKTAYLAGYLADKYDVSVEQCRDRAKARMKKSLEQTLRQTANGYSSLVPEQSSMNVRSASSHYALYPVWILNTTYEGKQYTFAMNGQTGKFVGDLPCDKKLVWKYRAIWFAAATAAAYLLLTLLSI